MITITTPALLFPAISLIMLAYTNRFLALATLVRSLHAKYLDNNQSGIIHGQIQNLRYRLKLIKYMQAYGVLSFVACVLCMLFVFMQWSPWAELLFGLSLIFFTVSLIISLVEIQKSTTALELELSNMEENEAKPSLVKYIKKKLEKGTK
ncbi:DUF2721 domain-containing protein [Olivibacter sp. SDN3]|uniref:DUF2721 domain-containing protein n=1 Tax=Olivibacter sp. SDN3 TaxID=2764720 RepID=UPI00165173A2|nr:DUF2721 domain-containing protein [Olivibacter sp. SDN3]QNL49323.1 DUF2721 domain-containing protein [Olivibacter sp. SDN3]